MMQTEKLPDFGTLLRYFRKKTTDSDGYRGGCLSQEKLAELLSKKTGQYFHRNKIEKWEKGQSFIHQQDERNILMELIGILHTYGGIVTLEDANHLLETGGYRALRDAEIGQIDSQWLPIRNKAADVAVSGPPHVSLKDVLVSYLSKMPESVFTKGAGRVLGDLLSDVPNSKATAPVQLYPPDCGNKPINLTRQRLLVSSTFGAYFTSLLEQENIYLDLERQIDCPAPKNQDGLQPLQRIFWLLEYAGGPRTIIIGGEGGMGKSTLAAKIIRCLYQEQAVDLILGDSAKSEYVDPITKEIVHLKTEKYEPSSFNKRLCEQLGLPVLPNNQVMSAINDRLVGRRAIILVDNLETIDKGSEIVASLGAITSRDVRAIVTTRLVNGLRALDNHRFVVHLQPLTETRVARQFLLWHIEQYQNKHIALRKLIDDVCQDTKVEWLINRTGGIPLLMQLLLSDVAKSSWSYTQTLPSLFGKELLNYLYQTRWEDLGKLGNEGNLAKGILKWISLEQYHGQKITSTQLSNWATENGKGAFLPSILTLLYERFLILNRDTENGDFSIYPSLSAFISQQ